MADPSKWTVTATCANRGVTVQRRWKDCRWVNFDGMEELVSPCACGLLVFMGHSRVPRVWDDRKAVDGVSDAC